MDIYVLTCTDHFPRWSDAIPLLNCRAVLELLVVPIECPAVVTTESDSYFMLPQTLVLVCTHTAYNAAYTEIVERVD